MTLDISPDVKATIKKDELIVRLPLGQVLVFTMLLVAAVGMVWLTTHNLAEKIKALDERIGQLGIEIGALRVVREADEQRFNALEQGLSTERTIRQERERVGR